MPMAKVDKVVDHLKGGDAKNGMLPAHESTHVIQQTGGGKMPKP